MTDNSYIQWLEERVVRLECELAEAKKNHEQHILNNIAFLNSLTQSLNNA